MIFIIARWGHFSCGTSRAPSPTREGWEILFMTVCFFDREVPFIPMSALRGYFACGTSRVPREGWGILFRTVCFFAWRCLSSRCLLYDVILLAGRGGRRPLRERVGRFCLGLFVFGGIGGGRPLRVRKEKELTGIDRFGQNRFLLW